MKNSRFLLYFCLLFAGFSCKSPTKNKTEEHHPHWFEKYTDFSKDNYYAFFKTKLSELPQTKSPYTNTIKNYYETNDYLPIWTLDGYAEQAIDTLVLFLNKSKEHGLPFSNRFDLIIDSIKTYKIEEINHLYNTLARLEINLTHALVNYANAVQFGMVDPVAVGGAKWFIPTLKSDSVFVEKTLAGTNDIAAFLHSIQPTSKNYIAMQKEMSKYLRLQDSTFQKIPEMTLDSGAVNNAIALVVKRLQLTNDLPENYVSNNQLDATLLKSINLFRQNNAIPESNQLDVETIKALNRNFNYYIDKLTANLERFRWKMNPAKDTSYIMVNLADFYLRAYRNNDLKLLLKVCVGKTEKKSLKERTAPDGTITGFSNESPVLCSSINQIVLNPQWYVPESIAKDEYYAKFVKDKSVIQKENLFFQDLKTGKPVSVDSVNWKSVNRNNFPYRIVQSSGRGNALGKIKFNFPNAESVYIHDTPSKYAFKYRNRAISHGCIRVENPRDLLLLIFDYNQMKEDSVERRLIDLGEAPTTAKGRKYLVEKTEAREKATSKMTDEERRAFLRLRPTYLEMKNKMPVYIEYYTCFLGENGDIQYRDDVYVRDQMILNKLKN